jgi:phenylacetate-coenzyme A ligase PaaK-like adenylate-forming protein
VNLLEEIRKSVFSLSGDDEVEKTALDVFRYQYWNNLIYREFVNHLNIDFEKIKSLEEIPFLPISLFRDQEIISGEKTGTEKIFTSSGTTGSIPSSHFVKDLSLYEESFLHTFRLFYGDPGRYRFLALLPGYLEREGSSLVYMMDHLIGLSKQNGSGFYLHDMDTLSEKLREKAPGGVQTVLFGASYALLDFAERYPMDLHEVIVMETGGMKGRKKEIIREDLHEFLCKSFNMRVIHSEYGMTELMSQAYSGGGGIFRAPPWMKILVRDTNDPMEFLPPGKTGGISIIDLANIHSCAFIATQDLGKLNDDGSFEILGRFDDSDIRGCNLLVV